MGANPPALYGDIGTVKEALQTLLLGADYERRLREVDARFSDGLTLERPTSEDQVETTELSGTPPRYPFWEIVAPATALNPDTDEERMGHEVDIIVWANGDTERDVTKLVERYVLAMRKTFRFASLMPFTGNLPIRVTREEYGLVGRKPDLARPFIKAGGIKLLIGTIE